MASRDKRYSLAHLDDRVLLHDLAALNSQDQATTAALLAHLAEVDERQLYLPAAHSSMHSFCVHEMHMSDDTAFRRIAVARAARQFPALFPALADGRLNMTTVLLLAAHLTPGNTDELVALVARRTKDEIRLLLAERFPKPDVPTLVHAVGADGRAGPPVDASTPQLALEQVGDSDPSNVPEPVRQSGATASPRARLAPLSPDRYELRVTVSGHAHDQMRYAQALLGHALPSGDLAKVLERALDALVEKLEKQRFAKGARSRAQGGHAKDRHIPAAIRCKVWQRDGGQCTFVSEQGKRCEAKKRLEFDHLETFACGGETTAENLRLLCRAHNQHAAECTFGAGFMREKREAARAKAAQAKEKAEAIASEQAKVREARAKEKAEAEKARARAKAAILEAKAREKAAATAAAEAARERDVTPWLRALGYNAAQARRGVELCAQLSEASMEDRIKAALRGLAPPCVRIPAPTPSGHA